MNIRKFTLGYIFIFLKENILEKYKTTSCCCIYYES